MSISLMIAAMCGMASRPEASVMTDLPSNGSGCRPQREAPSLQAWSQQRQVALQHHRFGGHFDRLPGAPAPATPIDLSAGRAPAAVSRINERVPLALRSGRRALADPRPTPAHRDPAQRARPEPRFRLHEPHHALRVGDPVVRGPSTPRNESSSRACFEGSSCRRRSGSSIQPLRSDVGHLGAEHSVGEQARDGSAPAPALTGRNGCPPAAARPTRVGRGSG